MQTWKVHGQVQSPKQQRKMQPGRPKKQWRLTQRLLSQSQMAWQALGTFLHLSSDMTCFCCCLSALRLEFGPMWAGHVRWCACTERSKVPTVALIQSAQLHHLKHTRAGLQLHTVLHLKIIGHVG